MTQRSHDFPQTLAAASAFRQTNPMAKRNRNLWRMPSGALLSHASSQRRGKTNRNPWCSLGQGWRILARRVILLGLVLAQLGGLFPSDRAFSAHSRSDPLLPPSAANPNPSVCSADNRADPAPAQAGWKCANRCIQGVYPHLASLSTSYTEAGIGALVPWADRLWYVSYVAHIQGEGVGLYEILAGCSSQQTGLGSSVKPSADGPLPLAIRRHPASIVGTHANRMIHPETQQLLIGPYVIDAKGQVRVIKQLVHERLTGTMRHLTDPAHKVYYLAMEGAFYEVDLATLQARKLFELTKELGIESRVHFKGAYTAQGRVVVANNSYFEEDQRDGYGRGRLAQWDGQRWTILQRTAFCDVTTAPSILPAPKDTSTLWANGWDRRSVLLCILHDGQWHTYRLPKGSQSYDQAWCTEWPRIRPLSPDLMLLDMHGLYYKMSPQLRPGQMGGLEPFAAHLKMTPDFCIWHDRLVLAGNENSSMNHRHRTGGQPQSNLWFGTLEQVGRWGRPSGWGGPWLHDPVAPHTPSDPFLVGGFEHRCLHLSADPMAPSPASSSPAPSPSCPSPSESDKPIQVALELDPDGSGQWKPYLSLSVPQGGYAWHVLPKSVQAVWMRLQVDRPARMSAQFHFAPGQPKAVQPELFAQLPLASSPPPLTGQIPVGSYNTTAGQDTPPASRTETGQIHGALLPFAERLWFCAYRDPGAGQRFQPAGLYEITESMQFIRRAESVPGVFSNRLMVGGVPGYLSIGPHLIAADGTVRTIPGLAGEHLVASVRLEETSPTGQAKPKGGSAQKKEQLGLLTATGRLLEVDLATLAVQGARDLPAELAVQGKPLRFRAAHTTGNTLIVAAMGDGQQPGLLAEQSGGKWRIIDQAHYAEVCNLGSMSEQVVAVGWDAASTILMLRTAQGWQKYRLPKASENYPPPRADYSPRIREVVTERILLDAGGLFYEVSGLPYAWSIRPITTHNRRIADFCSWRGLLVLAGCQTADAQPTQANPASSEASQSVSSHAQGSAGFSVSAPAAELAQNNRSSSEQKGTSPAASSGSPATSSDSRATCSGPIFRSPDGVALWFGTVDDLWLMGKIRGVGGPWLRSPVQPGTPSDPYLMCHFDRKRLELEHDADEPVEFTLEVDFTVQRNKWHQFTTFRVPPGQKLVYEFPEGYSAHWVRLKANRPCRATARFIYE